MIPPAATSPSATGLAASAGQPDDACGSQLLIQPPVSAAIAGSGLTFVKMEGLGNDFIVVDLRQVPPPRWLDDRAVIARLCDRHRGVGADGILAVLPPRPGVAAAARLRVRNADGSEAEMCGNGLRCVARYLFEQTLQVGQALPVEQRLPAGAAPVLAIETAAGVLGCELHLRSERQADPFDGCEIEIAMGAPRLARAEVPMLGPPAEPCVDEPIVLGGVGGETLRITAVSMGNPHAVIFVPAGVTGADLLALARRIGPQLETHPAFPKRTNVELCHRRAADEYEVVVWERGCGITQACGTGACAAVATGIRDGLLERRVQVDLPGGTLFVSWDGPGNRLLLEGPAEVSFTGQFEI